MRERETNTARNAMKAEKPDALSLLAAANSASERVSGLHVAFMAVSVYVLVIVFGTTDLDLLMGKGVKLPIVSVDVPIVGFYLFAPFIVVLVHFNLLLQLQLLSRKLFAFDAAAPQLENIGGLRDQLHIFPYTYYLVGRPSPLMRALIGLMVSITMVLLPLGTLLALQLQFLAYQSEVITWWQRVATWLDLAVVVTLWPIILDSGDDWRRYWRKLIDAYVPRRRVWAVFVLLLSGLVLLLFSGGESTTIGLVLLLLTPPAVLPLYGWKNTPRARRLYLVLLGAAALLFVLASGWLGSRILFLFSPLLLIPLALFWHPQAPRGSLALLMTFFIGLLVPLALLVDGERLESIVLRVQRSQSSTTQFSEAFLLGRRKLDLREQLLLTKSPKPETLTLIRSGNWKEAMKQIEPINLQDRSLRHASMAKAVLISCDLRHADLQGADLSGAKLQGADLSGTKLQSTNLEGVQLQDAELQRADLTRSRLQGADLSGAKLQGAEFEHANLSSAKLQGAHLEGALLRHTYLTGAQLQGADLEGALLYFANLTGAQLQGADLEGALLQLTEFQGADLTGSDLQGADLTGSELQGADLSGAKLRGANLAAAGLYGVRADNLQAELVDAGEVHWRPLDDKISSSIVNVLGLNIPDSEKRRELLNKLRKASRQGAIKLHLQSCLAPEDTPLICEKRFDPEKPDELQEFTRQLHTYLGWLACKSPEIARGILRQIPRWAKKENPDPLPSLTRKGLEFELTQQLLNDRMCTGLQNLSIDEKVRLRAMK